MEGRIKAPSNSPEGGESRAREQVLPFGEDLGGAMNKESKFGRRVFESDRKRVEG